MSSPDTLQNDTFISNILTPGSSLNPTFLLVLDVVLGSLLLILISLAVITSGNIHLLVLISIEIGLWISIKWCVNQRSAPHDQVD